MTDESEKPKKGFAGLSSMVSVVEVPEHKEPSQQTAKVKEEPVETQKRGSPLTFQVRAPEPEQPFWTKPWIKWALGIFVLILIFNAFDSSKSTSPKYSSSGYEEAPPVGNGLVLNSNQIRYCLSEKIRLDAWESVLNRYSSYAIDSFNGSVNDFNLRCSDYRYKQSAMNSASNQVDARRAEIYNEGIRKAAIYSGN
jgi:hypothetical protein